MLLLVLDEPYNWDEFVRFHREQSARDEILPMATAILKTLQEEQNHTAQYWFKIIKWYMVYNKEYNKNLPASTGPAQTFLYIVKNTIHALFTPLSEHAVTVIGIKKDDIKAEVKVIWDAFLETKDEDLETILRSFKELVMLTDYVKVIDFNELLPF